MARRAPLQTPALAVLVATLTCTLLPAHVLAGQGHGNNHREGQGQGENQGRWQSEDNRQSYESRHGNSNSNDNSNGRQNQQRQSRSPLDAAQQARSQYGGQVLKVQPAGGGYEVRLLQDDGRVVTVPIED